MIVIYFIFIKNSQKILIKSGYTICSFNLKLSKYFLQNNQT